MQNEELRKAINFIKNNQKQEGEKVLESIVQSNPNIELAWLWLATCKDKTEEKINCLEQALRINPKNVKVMNVLDALKQKGGGTKGVIKNDVESTSQYKKCPYCAEKILIDAIVCRYCGRDLYLGDNNKKSQNISLKVEQKQKAKTPITLDILFPCFLIAIVYIQTLQIFPGDIPLISMYDNPLNFTLSNYYDAMYVFSFSLVIAFIYSIVSLLILRRHPRISGGIWTIIALLLSTFPIAGLLLLYDPSRTVFEMYSKGYIYLLFPVFIIFVLGLVKLTIPFEKKDL